MLLLLSVAAAATPVVFDGSPDDAVWAVSTAAGQPVWQLEPVAVADLFSVSGTVLVAAGQPAACTGAGATNGGLREQVGRAEKLLLRQEWSEMRKILGEATAVLGCLAEPAEASLLSRLFFLDGFAAAEVGEGRGATVAFRRALASQPTLAWDARLDGAAKPLFSEVTAASSPALTWFAVGPGLETVTSLWIDGRPQDLVGGRVGIPVGDHVVQRLSGTVETFAVTAQAGGAMALVDGTAARTGALATAGTDSGSVVLEAAIEARYGRDSAAWVDTGTALYRLAPEWGVVKRPVRPAANQPRSTLPPVLIGAGGALTLVGGVGAALGWAAVAEVSAPVQDESDEAYDTRQAWLQDVGGWAYGSTAALGLGVATLGTGIVLELLQPGAVAVVPTPTGVAVAGRW